MKDSIEVGDRVTTRVGEVGTVLSIESGLARVALDNSLRRMVAVAALTKIDDEENTAL